MIHERSRDKKCSSMFFENKRIIPYLITNYLITTYCSAPSVPEGSVSLNGSTAGLRRLPFSHFEPVSPHKLLGPGSKNYAILTT